MIVKTQAIKLILTVAVVAVAGCSKTHTIYLNSGAKLDTAGEPSLDEDSGFYSFEDLSGREGVIDQNQVLKIEEK